MAIFRLTGQEDQLKKEAKFINKFSKPKQSLPSSDFKLQEKFKALNVKRDSKIEQIR
jgi:hypothetical protein